MAFLELKFLRFSRSSRLLQEVEWGFLSLEGKVRKTQGIGFFFFKQSNQNKCVKMGTKGMKPAMCTQKELSIENTLAAFN